MLLDEQFYEKSNKCSNPKKSATLQRKNKSIKHIFNNGLMLDEDIYSIKR